MSKWILAAASAVVFSVAGAVAWATVIGSAHDFQFESWNTTQTSCEVCHTAHHAMTPQLIPLWNHQSTVSFSLRTAAPPSTR